MTRSIRRTLALGALTLGFVLVVAIATVLGINLSNDAHRKRVVQNVVASLRPGMTADQAQAVLILHGLHHNRDAQHVGGIVRTPKGSMKFVHTDTEIKVTLGPDGLVSSVSTQDVHTSF